MEQSHASAPNFTRGSRQRVRNMVRDLPNVCDDALTSQSRASRDRRQIPPVHVHTPMRSREPTGSVDMSGPAERERCIGSGAGIQEHRLRHSRSTGHEPRTFSRRISESATICHERADDSSGYRADRRNMGLRRQAQTNAVANEETTTTQTLRLHDGESPSSGRQR
jgi:hypothetical protein